MSEYQIDFAERLLECAKFQLSTNIGHGSKAAAKLSVLHLSTLAAEVSLKSLLERASVPPEKIKRCHRDIASLLSLIGELERQRLSKGLSTEMLASKLASDAAFADPLEHVLNVLGGQNASTYPSDIGYQQVVRSHSPELVYQAAQVVFLYCRTNPNGF